MELSLGGFDMVTHHHWAGCVLLPCITALTDTLKESGEVATVANRCYRHLQLHELCALVIVQSCSSDNSAQSCSSDNSAQAFSCSLFLV